MTGSLTSRLTHPDRAGFAIALFLVAYVALSVLALFVDVWVASRALESVERASSDAPQNTDSALSLGGDLLP